VKREGDREVWAKQLADGGRAVVLFNRGPKTAELSVSWSDIGYPSHLSADVRDLWAGKDLGKLSGRFSAEVPSHGVTMVTIRP
jgi:alpha-galactosidase